ncbi:MAG: site-2 protease family protein [Candidatus Aminicenantales bacterium]
MDAHSLERPEILQKRPPSFFARNRVWLNIALFIVTVLSTFFVGFSWSFSYRFAEALAEDPQILPDPTLLLQPETVTLSVVYAVVLIGILLGHELGHFLTCRYYALDATLPYFIPAPTLIGTLGAFIKIRSPITRKKQLFDVGIAGPLTGFILSVPAIIYGLSLSKVGPSLPREESLVFGEPLLLRFIGSFIFKGIPEGFDVVPHPVAFAGWVGILVTALNLFPVGQLDGGHVVYAFIGAKSRKLAPVFLAVFVMMGIFFWVGWFLWALLISFLGTKHPRIADEHVPLSPGRRLLGVVVLIVFLVSFTPDPIMGYSLLDLLPQIPF